ncbi:MAG: GH3 auxin-responsive promoter family protein, partial [Bacteroidaceae bacterium]|nr:GH3 auxin-responsive promoter family protein [Bacteroidaceae bacterium]
MEQADYDYSKMTESNSLKPLQVIVARPGLFYDWLESKGKLGGQHKVPRFMTHDGQAQLFHLNLKNSN